MIPNTPFSWLTQANQTVDEWLKDKVSAVDFKLSVDPFIKPSNMRIFISSMYCDSLHKGSYWRVPVPLEQLEGKTAEEVSVVIRYLLDRALRDLQAHMAGNFRCDLHVFGQELNDSHNDSEVFCIRCGKRWLSSEEGKPTIVTSLQSSFPVDGATEFAVGGK